MTSPFWFFLLFCLALPGALGEGAPVDPSQADPPEQEEKRTAPWLELHGDYRYLYGKGRFAARIPANLKKAAGPGRTLMYSCSSGGCGCSRWSTPARRPS